MNRTLLWTRKFLAIATVAAIATAVVAAGCGGTSSADKTATASAKTAPTSTKPPGSATTAPASTSTKAAAATSASTAAPGGTSTASAATTTVKIGQVTSIGSVLTDPSGKTLYTYKDDVPNSGQSSVPAAIAPNWPPLLVTGTLVPPSGLTGQLGTFSRPDGSTQVMYKGMPLYTFVGDIASGQAKGQGLLNLWYAATP